MTSSPAKRPVWAAEGHEKRAAVRQMFAEIAPTYDLLNSVLTLRMHRRWRERVVAMLDLREGESALDVCSGTGDFLPGLRRAIGRGGVAVGVDFCEPMLQIARRKAGETMVLGDGCRLPFVSSSFDAVTVGWGIRNVPDVDMAHAEIARVLKPGGRFASIDMAKPRNSLFAPLANAVLQRGVPLIGRLFGKREAYTYLPKSTERFMSRQELAVSMERAGFRNVRYKDLFFGTICVHFGVKA